LSTNDLGLALACPFVVARFPARLPSGVPPTAAPAEEEVVEDAGLIIHSLVEEPAVTDGQRPALDAGSLSIGEGMAG
jgi:hypothetical protein